MKDKRELLKTGVFGVTNRGYTFVVVGDYLVYQKGPFDSVASCNEDLSLHMQKIQKLVECNSFEQLQHALDGNNKYRIIYDREKEPREIAVNNMLTLGISITYTNNFRRRGTVYLVNGKTTTPINEDTHPALYQFIKSVESSRDAIVYAVFNEPNVHGQKTDIYVLLYLEKDAAENPQYKIHKENNLCKAMTYNWCESTGIAEPALTYFQISDSGIWCLPYSIARAVAHHFDIPPKSPLVENRSKEPITSKGPSILIDELDLSVQSYMVLKRAGINAVDDLINMTYNDVKQIKNLGRWNVDEIIQRLHSRGLKLKEEPPREVLSIQELAMQITVGELNMSTKTTFLLKQAGINTVEDIIKYTDWDFLLLKNGEKGIESFCEIEAKLNSMGLKLKENPLEKLTID